MSTPARHGEPWMDDETHQLLQEVKKKYTLDQMASSHQRSHGGIKARLRQMAADYYYNDNRSIEEIMKFTGLEKEIVLNAIEKRQWRETKKETQGDSISVEPKREYATQILAEIRDMMKEMLVLMKKE